MTSRVSTPRIDASYLEQYMGRTVILVGRVVELRGETAMIESNGMVTVMLPREAHLVNGNGAHIVGKVGTDATVKVLSAQDLGPHVDYEMYNNVVNVTHQLPDVFVCQN